MFLLSLKFEIHPDLLTLKENYAQCMKKNTDEDKSEKFYTLNDHNFGGAMTYSH